MQNTVIFTAYPPFFYDEITLMDISAGILTISLILTIFSFKDDSGNFSDFDTDEDYFDDWE